MTFYALFVVFRFLGRNYDAAVITSGFAGLGLGATPVAIANMDDAGDIAPACAMSAGP